jgi:hypothetical protein
MALFDRSEAQREMAQEAQELASQTETREDTTTDPAAANGAAATAGQIPMPEESVSAGDGDDPGERDDQPGTGSRHVPFSALKAERQKRQQIERDLHTLQGQVRAWQNAMLSQIQGTQDAERQGPPNVEEDPVGALRHTQQQLADLQAAVAGQVRAQQLQGAYVAGATAFSRANPDFAEAYNHMIQSRANELRVLGAPEPAIAQQLRLEEQQMVAAAINAGRNPAEVAYAAAKARGWQSKGSARSAGEAGSGAPAANRAAAAMSLSTGGRPNRDSVSAEDVARLSGRDFDAGWEKLFGRRSGGSIAFAGR